MTKVPYTKSIRKQLEWVAIFFFLINLAGWLLYPVNTLPKIIFFGVLAVLIGAVTIFSLRKINIAASCPNCGTDLYEVIQVARFKKSLFRHCPACGEHIEV